MSSMQHQKLSNACCEQIFKFDINEEQLTVFYLLLIITGFESLEGVQPS